MNKPFDLGKEEIAKLCKYFETNRHAFLASGVKEAHIRQSLIDPLFVALGWDVRNDRQVAPQYREVVVEESLDVEGHRKAPDYAFRVGQTAKFYAEAKKCGINIKTDPAATYQLRSYAWSAKLPMSILTDFEEFAYFDCTKKPKPGDKVGVGRLDYMTFEEYPDRWRELWDIFSREAIWSGSFDQFAEKKRGKRGTAEVDDDFLREIEGWRDVLARNIALRNPKLGVEDLNRAVQLTIDRIIFLRMAEDRHIEPYEKLLHLTERENIYKHFITELCQPADAKYNSGLFDLECDQLFSKLKIDDKVLGPILRNLYQEHDCPYQFSVMPVEILGTVYERFLGRTITLTKEHRARIEEKPEVRKAGGVYYTPKYIVDYIVEHTVGRLIEDKDPKQLCGTGKKARSFRVLDMACGSGSFLLGAYQKLLDYYRDWYTNNNPKKHPSAVWEYTPRSGGCVTMGRGSQNVILNEVKNLDFSGHEILSRPVGTQNDRQKPITTQPPGETEWRLTIAEKKRILITHIFGVDIDAQAVEVTKLSLLLKVLEGEDEQSLSNQRMLFELYRALPNLADNIKCGNSLIGPDYFTGNLIQDPDELGRVNPFDWQTEFPDAMQAGGFDCVIGNPPYVFGRDWKALGIVGDMKDYLGNKFRISPYQLDMFSLFMEQSFRVCKIMGRIGQIVPNVWLTNTYSSITRSYILKNSKDLEIASTPKGTFPKLTVDTVVYTLSKDESEDKYYGTYCLTEAGVNHITTLPVMEYLNGEKPISISVSLKEDKILKRIRRESLSLSEITEITRGVHPYRIGGYGKSAFSKGSQTKRDVEERPYHSATFTQGYRPFIYGKDLKRFTPPIAKEYIKYGTWLAEPRNPKFFEGDRVYSRKILSDRLLVTVEKAPSIADQQVYITKPTRSEAAAYLAGVLGSSMIAFFIRKYYDEVNDAFPQIKVSQLKQLPIRPIDFDNPDDVKKHDRMVQLVESMLSLHEQLPAARSEREKTLLENQIGATDKAIDELVYALYGLTDDEIRIVEGR